MQHAREQTLCELTRRLLIASAVCVVTLAFGGCIKPLFPEDKPRTQFDSYEQMRSRYIPLEEPDVFGTPRPALRARLSPQN